MVLEKKGDKMCDILMEDDKRNKNDMKKLMRSAN
jgi:hypothetical protein